ncbi:uncharacterized protein LOC124119067 isoform X2 [Haliotis rufescens]|uniref:uncharacterized protein LOC124119067 isoform X2 n=1 Tax=Haliotis rufescens TaxID=6454 RepID=UPI001EB098D8|nr:uncharacterized protein LOC124119067 isoform X2 [Haliotis rufescens]
MVNFRQSSLMIFMGAGAFCMLVFEHVVLPHFSYRLADDSIAVSSMSAASADKTPGNVNDKIRFQSDSSQTPPSRSSPSPGKTLVYRFNGRQMQQLHEFCTWTVHVDCVPLKTPSGETPIHIHDIVVDKWVSKDLKQKGAWEPGNINLVLSELKKDPELGFMDLGSHVGAFSLSVAKFGRKVVSVDPLIENVQRLSFTSKDSTEGGQRALCLPFVNLLCFCWWALAPFQCSSLNTQSCLTSHTR